MSQQGLFTVIFVSFLSPFFLSSCATTQYASRSKIWTREDLSNPPLLEEEVEAEKRGELPHFDIPVVRNAKVEQWLQYFQGRGRKVFRVWLERSGKYIPFMRKIIREHGLPEDLVYLAMIESGFSPRAYSRARAVGHWQFMRSTGRLYGLKVDFWRDERRDPEKATVAAARHLKDLYDKFQDWKLAAAAYNAGQAKVTRAINRYKTEDFWELTRGHYLSRETRNYVPKLIAAALIAKSPRKYGFKNIDYQSPLEYDKIVIRKPVNLRTLAKKANYSLDKIMSLNPELNHAVTPPNVKNYELRVPRGTSERFIKGYKNLGPQEFFQYASYRIRRGDTISQIARYYGVPQREIFKLNRIRSARSLRPGHMLLLPLPRGTNFHQRHYRHYVAKRPVRSKRSSPRYAASQGGNYVVRTGDSLWSISRRYGVSIYKIKRMNSLRSNRLRRGQRLKLPDISSSIAISAQADNDGSAFSEDNSDSRTIVHVVRRGETLWSIAQRYGTSIRDLKIYNKLHRNRIIPGRRLVIPST